MQAALTVICIVLWMFLINLGCFAVFSGIVTLSPDLFVFGIIDLGICGVILDKVLD